MISKQWLLAVGMSAVLALGVAACGSDEPAQAQGGGQDEVAAAPDFSGTTLDGEEVSLGGFGGKPTILVFWASW